MQDRELVVIHDLLHQFELVLERWEKSVAIHGSFHQGEIEIGAAGQGLRVDLSAATDEYFVVKSRRIKFLQRIEDQDIFLMVSVDSCEMKLIRAP